MLATVPLSAYWEARVLFPVVGLKHRQGLREGPLEAQLSSVGYGGEPLWQSHPPVKGGAWEHLYNM